MHILYVGKYPPIQGGVSVKGYWLANALVELGHDVTVLTNADEVESRHRVMIDATETNLLCGYRMKNAIHVVSTKHDDKHTFIPRTNPFLTKLVSEGLRIINESRPDFIWAHYVEPYGIAALFLSKLTGVPYVIRHAGSDLGKLGLLEDMKYLHEQVYREAVVVATVERHHGYFKNIGVPGDNLHVCGFLSLPADVFYRTPLPVQKNGIRLLVYGKTGRHKGTPQIIEAMSALGTSQFPVQLRAFWGECQKSYTLVREQKLGHMVQLQPYVPHWLIADEIRNAHAVLFLENKFSITIHAPGIPLEILACGRPIITTQEIVEKFPHLLGGLSTVRISGDVVTAATVADAIRTLPNVLKKLSDFDEWPDSDRIYARSVSNLERFLSIVASRI